MGKIFNPEVLSTMIRENGLSIENVALSTGVDEDMLTSYLWGEIPSLDNLIKLADFFAVSIDCLVGRCSDEVAKGVVSDYGHRLMELSRTPCGAYLTGRDIPSHTEYTALGESPWPYNLVTAVLGMGVITDMIDAEHEADIVSIINESLDDARSSDIILEYFRNGRNLAQISEKISLPRSKVQQIIWHSLVVLRRPPNAWVLRYGKTVTNIVSQTKKAIEIELFPLLDNLEAIRETIASKRKELKDLNDEINTRYEILKGIQTEPSSEAKTDTDVDTNHETEDMPWLTTDIADIGLSTRAYNSLWRGGIKTLRDVIAIIKKGDLMTIRNLGKKTGEEILTKVNELTGLGLSLDDQD